MKKPIPVTILTGFLGSGKTTLLNKILDNKEGYKIAVIENEYGEESIDGELVKKNVEELIEIKDGCMCCVVRGDLIKGVQKLLNSGKDIDYLIVEASGMSEPGPVAQTFIMEDFDGRIKLDSVVCIVDAQNFHSKIVQSLQTTFEQIESSHFMILNKVEGVSQDKINEIKKTIRKINEHSAIIESNYCAVDIDNILDINLVDVDSFEKEEKKHHHKHSHDHQGYSHSHEHDKKEVNKYFFKTEVPCFHIENMRQFLSEISDNIFRMKGFIHFKDYPNDRYILQKAGSCFTMQKDEDYSGENKETKIVFIGKYINKQDLHDKLFKDVFFEL